MAKAPPAGYGWKQVAGAEFAAGASAPKMASDQTPFTVDFYTVSFSNPRAGLAGGAACQDAVSFSQIERGDSGNTGLCGGKPRVPVVYSYSKDSAGVGSWSRVVLPGGDGSGSPSPGYVGAIAWIGPGEALAVGGRGSYVRRELGQAVDGAGYSDPAGSARAWLYRHGSWSELGHLPSEADGNAMRGMQALDCSTTQRGFCVAGGLGQLWMFRDGRFAQGYDSQSASGLENASSFIFRVRQIRFNTVSDTPQVVAVTSGCCAAHQSDNFPMLLTYDGIWHVPPAPQTCVPLFSNTCANNPQSPAGTPLATTPFSYFSAAITKSYTTSASLLVGPDGPAPGDRIEPASTVEGGFFQLQPTSSRYGLQGGPLVPQPSPYGTSQTDAGASSAQLGGFRLTAGDGDVEAGCNAEGCGSAPDLLMDWAVGGLTAGASVGQGAAFTTAPSTQRHYSTDSALALSCSGAQSHVSALQTPGSPTSCKPNSPQQVAQQEAQSAQLFALGSYTLNGYALIPGSDVGWAVGDDGALLERSPGDNSGSVVGQPSPPALGQATPGALPDRSAYEPFSAVGAPGQAGTVPALASRPLEHLGAPAFVAGGAPEEGLPQRAHRDVSAIVMSRSGSEGWALGPGANGSRLTLYHYDGANWTLCDPDGISGVLAADPACQGLAPLEHTVLRSGVAPESVRIVAAARVPTEKGPDASRADDFEVVAVGTLYSADSSQAPAPVVLRYTGGRWRVETGPEVAAITAMGNSSQLDRPLHDVVFTAPDDGWIIGDSGIGPGAPPWVFHYDGRRWVDCAKTPKTGDGGACSDPQGRLPFQNTEQQSNNSTRLRMAVAGDRVYLYGTRVVYNDANTGRAGSATTLAGGSGAYEAFPMILYRDRGGSWRADGGGFDPGFGLLAGQNATQQGRV
ncbi:MAG TPA: hypothetical protein VGN69_06675, partial [Solirubrobacteraceae bacterium]|nr:hypothetical protein [Solirubrobacteraceae bacterium]